MSGTGSSNIPSTSTEAHADRSSAALPARARLASSRLLRKGRRSKADLLLVDTPGGPTIVKDFGGKTAWVRLTGRVMIRRELRAYRRLAAQPGVPRLVGRIDAHALALEYVDATQLAFSPQRKRAGAEKLEQLRTIVEGLHSRGVAHCDLRSRDNVLVDRDGRLHVVDFAAAICLRPGGWLHRLFFGWIALVDRSALLKWKQILEAGPMTHEERLFADRFRVLRSLWFHRRHAWRGKTRPPA